MNKQAGFTLIEIIVVLVLAGILAAIAGMGIVQGVEGYLMTKENTALTQKSQLTLERIRREMLLLNVVTAAGSTSMQFTNPVGTRTIGLDGQTVKLAEGATALTAGDILVGGVSSFSLAYFKDDGTVWTQGSDSIGTLAEIRIGLGLTHMVSGVGSVSFAMTVNPRNNGVLNSPVG